MYDGRGRWHRMVRIASRTILGMSAGVVARVAYPHTEAATFTELASSWKWPPSRYSWAIVFCPPNTSIGDDSV